MPGSGRVEVGRVIRPHALAGGVRVKPEGSTVALLNAGDAVEIVLADGGTRDLTVAHRSGSAAGPILRFQEVSNRDEAEALRNGLIRVDRDQVPVDPDGRTFLVSDLVGCSVFSGERLLGVVVEVHSAPANDSLEVKGEGGDRLLLPFTVDAVRELSIEERRLVIRPDLLGPEVAE